MQEMKLRGKVAIVTGAARGMGRAIALHLAKLGADVLVADKSFAAAGEFGEIVAGDTVASEIESLGQRGELFEGDLTTRDAARGMVERCIRSLGHCDILVNNAGGMVVPLDRSQPSLVAEEDDELIFDLNYRTMLHSCQAVAPTMTAQRSGIIVNVSSGAARYIPPGGLGASYGAAKAAVSHFTRSLALELGPSGIRVNSIAPGVVLTARVVEQARRNPGGRASNPADIPLGRFANAEDCALVVEFLVTDLSRYVTGQSISVCGGRLLTPA